MATAVASASDPISGLPQTSHGWFLVPYLIFEDFLLFMIVWIAPWVAIFLTDWALRRGRYDSRALLSARAGVYWRSGGVHIPGVVAQAIGMLAAASWLDTTVWQGPLAHATGGADLSVFMGALFGGGVYFLLARRSVPGEAARAEGGVAEGGVGGRLRPAESAARDQTRRGNALVPAPPSLGTAGNLGAPVVVNRAERESWTNGIRPPTNSRLDRTGG